MLLYTVSGISGIHSTLDYDSWWKQAVFSNTMEVWGKEWLSHVRIIIMGFFITICFLAVSYCYATMYKDAVMHIIFNWCSNLFRPGGWQLSYTWASYWWRPSSCWMCWLHRCQIPILKFDEMPKHWPSSIVPDFCFVTWNFMNTGIQEMGTMQQRLVYLVIAGFAVQSAAYEHVTSTVPVYFECNRKDNYEICWFFTVKCTELAVYVTV